MQKYLYPSLDCIVLVSPVSKFRPPSLSSSSGVPQGSIIGPSIFINDIPHAVNSAFIHLYADDTILDATGPSDLYQSESDIYPQCQRKSAAMDDS